MRVALIGTGYWGSILLRYLEFDQNIEVVSICNSSSDLLRDVYDNDKVDAVVVATPNDTHYAIVRDALSWGKHVLSEKPLALTVDECRKLAELAKDKDVILETNYIYTYSQSVQKLCDELKDKERIGLEMIVKHLGRFGGGSVYWLLGSHMLSVLDMIEPLNDIVFARNDVYKKDGVVETGDICFIGKRVSGRITVGLNSPVKEVSIHAYADGETLTYCPHSPESLLKATYERKDWTIGSALGKTEVAFRFDESNNLRHSIQNFTKVVDGLAEQNTRRAILVTKILEELQA